MEEAQDILDRHTKCLHDTRQMDVHGLEGELRDRWRLGYQTLKDIMIDMLVNHNEYSHVAAYYMEHSNVTGVVMEFQSPLSKLYGLTSWNFDETKDQKRSEFWDTAFAAISQFDVHKEVEGRSILQVGSLINSKLIKHFLDHPNDLRSMDSRHFEELIAELFDGFGYRVELTVATRDGGRDVIAIGNQVVAESKFLIECKRYAESNRVGILPVRSLHGVVQDERATKGIIATTSTFTAPAREFLERNRWTLEGRDFEGVIDWLKTYQRMKFSGKDP